MMDFMQAVINMQDGERMIRVNWIGFYLTILHGQNYISAIGKGDRNNPGVSVFIPSVEDIIADDWMIKLN